MRAREEEEIGRADVWDEEGEEEEGAVPRDEGMGVGEEAPVRDDIFGDACDPRWVFWSEGAGVLFVEVW